jgi:hypothetical protein
MNQGVLNAWRAESDAMLAGVVSAATTGADPQARPPRGTCPRCGRGRPALRWRPRSVETRLGSMTFTRTRYRCRPCQQTWSGADRTLELAPRQRTSAGLARWEADIAGRTTFREAAELLDSLAGVHVGSETSRTHAERVGTELEGRQQRAMVHVQGHPRAVTRSATEAGTGRPGGRGGWGPGAPCARVLHLPGMLEDMPGDPPGRVAPGPAVGHHG